MAFDVGSLTATLRMNLAAFKADQAQANAMFKAAGAAADEAGAKADAAGTKAAAGAKRAADAARDEAAAQKASGAAAVEASGQKVTAAQRAAAASKAEGQAASSTANTVAGAATKEVAAGEKAESELRQRKKLYDDLALGVGAFGAAAAAGFGVAVAATVEFGQRQAQLQTLTAGSTRSAAQLQAQMQLAAQAALTYGTAYGDSATQVQDAEIELTKAGVGVTAQLNGALKGALVLAAAGQEDVADATSTAVTAMTQFNLTAADVPHVADDLAAGADKALGSVSDLSMALKQGGLVASQMGLSIDDTVGTLSAFANAGLIGSDAGTSFKTMLLALQSPSSQAKKYLDEYNISAYDSQGAFVGITNLAGQLHDKLSGLSQAQRDAALSTIFGTDAIRSANVLYDEGSKGIAGWISDVNDSGFAARQAAGKMDSLAGDSTKLAAAWQTGLIKAGNDLTPILRLVVQGTTGVVTAFSQVDPVTAAIGVGLLGVVGAVGLLGAGLLVAIPRIAEFQVAARTLATQNIPVLSSGLRTGASAITSFRSAASKASSFLGGPFGAALLVGVVALDAYNAAVSAASASSDTLDAAAGRGAAGVDQLLKAAAQGENVKGFLGALADGENIDVETSALDGLSKNLTKVVAEVQNANANPFVGFFADADLTAEGNTLTKVGESLGRVASTNGPAAAAAFEEIAKRTDGSRTALTNLLETMPAYESALTTAATAAGVLNGHESDAQRTSKLLAFAQKEAGSAATTAATAEAEQVQQLGEIAGSASGATESVSDLSNALKGLGSTQLDVNSAERSFQQAVDDATTAATKNGKGLDISTKAGRANQAALDTIASSAAAAAGALETNGASQRDVTKAITDGRSAYIKAAEAMGESKAQADKLADSVGLIPKDVRLLFKTSGLDDVSDALSSIIGLENRARTTVSVNGSVVGLKVGDSTAKASGGSVTGGTPGKDSVPILAMPGEHVLTTKDVAAMGGQSAVYAFRASLHPAGYADGGAISSSGTRSGKTTSGYQADVDAAKKRLAALTKKATAAEARASKASDATASIYGTGSGSRKHQAELVARAASKAAKAADKAVTQETARLSSLEDKLTKSQQLDSDAVDLQTSVGRGTLTDPSSPYSGVDEAVQASRDSNYSSAQRKALASVAAAGEKTLERLAKQADTMATKIDDDTTSLQNAQSAFDDVSQAATSLASSVSDVVDGFFSLSDAASGTTTSLAHNAGTAAEWDEQVSTASSVTAGSLAASANAAATSDEQFAASLQALVQKGYSTAVVQSVAQLGVSAGSQVAASLLAGTSDDVAALNSGYARQAAAGVAAGSTVSGQAYGTQLEAAQAAVTLAQQQLTQDQQNADATNAAILAAQNAIVAALQNALGIKKAATGMIRDAQIAPAGRNILWAEPESGGEAYIPFAAGNRSRSLAILSETARRLGRAVVPLAEGGFYSSSSSSSSSIRYGNTIFSGPVFGTPDQILAAADRRSKAARARANRQAGIGRGSL